MRGFAHSIGFALLLLIGMVTAQSASAADISGTWILTVETSAGGGTPTFTFEQKGETLSGTYKGRLGEAPVSGTIKGDDVTFEFQAEAQGMALTVTYTGKVNGTSMSGTVALGQFAQGTFTGQKK